MRQAVITRHGPPDVFSMREGPDPVPRPGELRIRVRAAGVNFSDILSPEDAEAIHAFLIARANEDWGR